MHSNITDYVAELKHRRRALLKSYDDENLHQLRVNIRRLRGLLKQRPDKASRKLRRELGKLVKRTNRARDWDTLAGYAARVLTPGQLTVLRPVIAAQQAEPHRKALRMLQTRRWSSALKQLKKYRDSGEPGAVVLRSHTGESAKALKREKQARRQALARGDDDDWHALRIAIKDLRYTLESRALSGKGPKAEVQATIHQCKQLQDALGDWHDAVVHQSLLKELAASAQALEDPEVMAVVELLAGTLSARSRDCLKPVREILDRAAE
ncbi:CHAD domain-containing protein [Parahaliea maris]|uniref:CHAD domain-containing protein n=1 Tax=Parahaliea maris TaxID=2716870 RepID=A0A5C9A7B7_9GAMM|nr:CHAD domain-containing protein [Parahaliea maris]TXS95560.1 CHAD domain-containing protein [Parahaliea maris]